TGGTKTFSLSLKTAGTATITASDVTHASVISSTSPAISVSPGAFVKLQLLAPGETASPGSANGKTGSPAAQAAGASFNITVNAVDANWNLVSSVSDAIGITSSDANATMPASASLVGGTKAMSVTFVTAGNQTLTATDVDDGTRLANTSPPIS